MRFWFFARIAVALAATLAIAAALLRLSAAWDGVTASRAFAGATPVTLFEPKFGPPGPLVVIAHGFAGSQQLMQPFALTLARNGYRAATFDFLGHGRNPEPMRGDITKETGVTPLLVEELGRVAAAMRSGDEKLALVGHSMASDIVVRYAQAHPEVEATVAVSLFSPGVTEATPRNLLVIVEGVEPGFLKSEAMRVTGMQAGGAAQERVTYGDRALGTARRMSVSAGVEHIGVLYSPASLREALDWLNAAFGRSGDGYLDARGGWLGLLFGGLIMLAWPLAGLLPRIAPQSAGASLAWRSFWPLAVAPAALTPLVLWKMPTDFLPILLGDYLTAHFAVYGLLTFAGLGLAGALRWTTPAAPLPLLASSLAIAAFCIFAIGLPIDAYVASFMPIPQRATLIPVVLLGTLPWFLADEWLTRGASAPFGAYAFTKLCFLLSLAGAVALNLERLFFLIIIIPAMLVFLAVYGLFSQWAYRRTGHPWAAAAGNALALAWAIAVTFPLYGA